MYIDKSRQENGLGRAKVFVGMKIAAAAFQQH
jgi:hypothetical protein